MYLTQAVHRWVRQDPDAIATVDGDRTRTYRELADRVSRLAGGLRASGVAPGDRVAYLGANSDRFVEFYIAVAWADAVAVPVNIRWSPAEIAFSLVDSGTEVLIVDDTKLPLLDAVRNEAPDIRVVIHAGDGPAPAGLVSFDDLAVNADAVADVRQSGDALSGIFYTGGTTGFPKGVMLSHTNLLSSAYGALAASTVSSRPRALHVAPLFHIASYACVVPSLIAGGVQVMLPGFEPAATLAAIEREQITDLGLVPIMLQLIADHPQSNDYDLSSLITVFYGGSSITPAALARVLRRLPGVRIAQAFGQTEASPVLTWLDDDAHHDLSRPGLLASAGRAAPHTEVMIVDETGTEVPRGEQGEIVGRGGNIMLGYWNRPEETAAAIRDGWLHTGDIGRMDDEGYLYVLDRLKDMIVTGGENVFSAEVENAVATHPAVVACAVIGLPHEVWGERVHAVVVLDTSLATEVTGEEIRTHVRTRIAGYKVPATVEFIAELPVSATGKVLKRELRAARGPVANEAVEATREPTTPKSGAVS